MSLADVDGLHLRPLTEFLQVAETFDSDVFVVMGPKRANGKRIFELMELLLGEKKADELYLEAEGPDAERALDALEKVLQRASRQAATSAPHPAET